MARGGSEWWESGSARLPAVGAERGGAGREPEVEAHHDLVVHLAHAHQLRESLDPVVLEADRPIPTHSDRIGWATTVAGIVASRVTPWMLNRP